MLWTAGGLGRLPLAPGTFGTLPAVALALLLPGDLWIAGVAAVIVLASIPLVRMAERVEGRADPGSFVLDEVAGYLVTVLWLPRSIWMSASQEKSPEVTTSRVRKR